MRAFAIWLLSASLAAANPATDAALKAADDLRGAIAELDAAQTKADRVAALTKRMAAHPDQVPGLLAEGVPPTLSPVVWEGNRPGQDGSRLCMMQPGMASSVGRVR